MPLDVMMIVLTAGRPYVLETLPAWRAILPPMKDEVVVDDSGDPERREWLATQDMSVLVVSKNRAGYNAAMQKVFEVAACAEAKYVFLLEDDFLPRSMPDLADVLRVMDAHPHLAQMVFKRQAWWGNEIERGGVLEALDGPFVRMTDGGARWIEHRAFWSCNPMVFRRSLALRGWPVGAWSEARFGRALFSDTDMNVAMWGEWGCPPQVEHVGEVRAGDGY